MPSLFYLDGKPIYKLSMSNVFKGKQNSLLDVLKERGWLVLDGSAGNGQGERFKQSVAIGDYVYVCIGSRELWGIYRVTGDWKQLPEDIVTTLRIGKDWGYRTAELVATPVKDAIWTLKNINKLWAPSGFSTFFQVKDLAGANEHIFEPFFDRTLVADSAEPILKKVPVPEAPRNQILYGPPGTGKTYHTTARAVALLEGITDEAVASQYPPEKRSELRQKFEDYRAAGRVAFVTFHQAFSYEDFVEGIKPLPPTSSAEGDVLSSSTGVQYDVQAGIFSRICETAFTAANATVAPPVPAFDELYADFAEQLRHRMSETRGLLTFSSKTGEPMVLKAVADGPLMRLTFLHGNSGQLDHHIDKPWIKKLYEKYDSIDQIKKLKQDITDVVGGSNATLMWVVFNELKKHEAAWLARARETERQKLQDTTAPPHVLIIDEINRGNVANIFGELITLLEDDKRTGRSEAVTVQLPYSKKAFSVPDNLFVLGTMNTADRSVEALDTALRRRFSFTEMLPQPELLSPHQMIARLWWHHWNCGWHEEPYVSAEKKLYGFLGCEELAKTDQEPRWEKLRELGSTTEITQQIFQDVTMTGIDMEQMLRAINARLEQLLDHDHCIGHALLIHVQDFAGLQQAFQRNILPLLKEYFFGDWGKIGLVLGEAFITQVNKNKAAGTIGLKKFSGYSVGELSEKPVYHFVDPRSLEPKDFQEIYA